MTLSERLEAVAALATAETGKAIPQLAQMERQATGWGCIALVGVLGFVAAAVALFALSSILAGWGVLVVQLLALLLRQVAPQSVDAWLAVILLVTAAMVFFSARWRSLMQDETLWQQTRARDLTGYAHLALSVPIRAGMTLLAASFLPLILFAPVYVLTQWRILSAAALAELRTMLPAEWGFAVAWLPLVLLALAPFLFVDWKRRAPRWRMIGLAFVLCGGLAAVWLGQDDRGIMSLAQDAARRPLPLPDSDADLNVRWLTAAPFRLAVGLLWRGLARLLNQPWFMAPLAVYITLGLAYPLGLSYEIARVFYLPYAIFRNTWAFITERARLRRRISRVLDDHLGRNKQRVRGDGWGTVCSNHLRRFVEVRSRRGYLRPVAYHLCPVCQLDTHAYNNVGCISVLLDESMTTAVRRLGETLYLNGLWWPEPEKHSQAMEAPFESLVIGSAHHLAVESFVNHCEVAPALNQALRDAPCHVVAGHTLHENNRPMLEGKVKSKRVATEFSLTDSAVPCYPGMRQLEASKRNLHRGLRVLVMLLGLAVLLVVALFLWRTVLG